MSEKGHNRLTYCIKNGDKKAFREIYDAYYRQLLLVSRKYLKDTQMAEDAVQDIFVKLWLNRMDLDPSKSLKSFLFTCLKNHVLNIIKSQKRRILLAYRAHELKSQTSSCTDDDIIYSEYKEIVKEGLEKLPQRRREVFKLKMYHGLTNTQVSKNLSISINTVKNHYYHSNKFLRTYLKKTAGIQTTS